jgi:hypothetical protein
MEEKIVVYPDDVNEYHYNCQVWKYSHGAWWYSGEGKFCENLEQVMEYAKKRKLLLEFR